MRTLEQCKAEIFRRSEEIIKRRKMIRRCVIAACLPVVFVLGICSAMLIPAMMPAKAENAMAESDMLADTEKYSESSTNNSPTTESVTVVVEGIRYPVFGKKAAAAKTVLQELGYSPAKVCKCLPQFQVITESGSYGIHLGEGYARCEAGQALLTPEQVDILRILLYTAIPDEIPAQKKT